jgi:hypothetical protein
MSLRTRRSNRSGGLRREILAILVFKAVALWLIWAIWFSEPQGRKLDDGNVASAMVADIAGTDATPTAKEPHASRHGSR